MGLRHLPVIDAENRPIGIITRKDLMAWRIEECVHHVQVEERAAKLGLVDVSLENEEGKDEGGSASPWGGNLGAVRH